MVDIDIALYKTFSYKQKKNKKKKKKKKKKHKKLAPSTLDHEIPGSNPARGAIQLMSVLRVFASLLLSFLHRPDIT